MTDENPAIPETETLEDLICRNFETHPAQSRDTINRHSRVRSLTRGLALELGAILPASRERTMALCKLEEVMFWSNASIARNQELAPDYEDDAELSS